MRASLVQAGIDREAKDMRHGSLTASSSVSRGHWGELVDWVRVVELLGPLVAERRAVQGLVE